MSPYLAEMKKNLAASCHLAVTQVNIKATTMEAMGFVGKKKESAQLPLLYWKNN